MTSGQLLLNIYASLQLNLPAGVRKMTSDGTSDDNSIVFEMGDGSLFCLESSNLDELADDVDGEDPPYYAGLPVDPANPAAGTYVRETEPGRWLVNRPGRPTSYTTKAPPPRHHVTSPPDSTIDRCFTDAIDTTGFKPIVISVGDRPQRYEDRSSGLAGLATAAAPVAVATPAASPSHADLVADDFGEGLDVLQDEPQRVLAATSAPNAQNVSLERAEAFEAFTDRLRAEKQLREEPEDLPEFDRSDEDDGNDPDLARLPSVWPEGPPEKP